MAVQMCSIFSERMREANELHGTSVHRWIAEDFITVNVIKVVYNMDVLLFGTANFHF